MGMKLFLTIKVMPVTIERHDICPKCKNQTMPPIKTNEGATARCCQWCAFVEELEPSLRK